MNLSVTPASRGWSVKQNGSLCWTFPDKGEAIHYASDCASKARGTLTITHENGEVETRSYNLS